MQKDIPPYNGDKYVDQFWSSMYATYCSFGQSEQRLIWMRYSALLIVQGIILGFCKECIAKPAENAPALFCAGFLGLALCSLWAFLNYCGWKNQNMFFWHAAQLKFKVDDLRLPTDFFIGIEPPEPYGSIYYSAQFLPAVFWIVDYLCVYLAMNNMPFFSGSISWCFLVGIPAVSMLLIYATSRLMRKQKIA